MACFRGKIALVTGSGSGIGRAVCRVLARDGATVVAADIDHTAAKETVAQLPATGTLSHLALQCDVSSSSSVNACFNAIISQLSHPPTLLSNTAGITRDNFIKKLTEEHFDEVLQVNLKGTFLLTQAFSRALLSLSSEGAETVPGAVVNVSSVVAKGGNAGQSNYAASKAGVEAFSKSAAKELARQQVRVNCVLPGFIDTPMIATIPEHLTAIILQMIPQRRSGQPEEVAEVIAFLLSDRASYVTGSCVDVTGGLTGTM